MRPHRLPRSTTPLLSSFTLLAALAACDGGKPSGDSAGDGGGDDGGEGGGDGGGEGGEEGEAVDVLIVYDSSSSTADEAALLGMESPLSLLEGLRYQVGLTTVTVDYASEGATSGVDAGEFGTLAGDYPVVTSKDDLPDWRFRSNLLCDTVCWQASALDDDPSFACTDPTADPPPSGLSVDYLDCLCGEDAWKDHCGSGTEEGLEAVLLSLCLGVSDPPEACLDCPWCETEVPTLRDTLPYDLIRGAPVRVLLLTDEGDSSRRLSTGDEDATVYLDALGALGLTLTVDVIGPSWDEDAGEFPCNSGAATAWGVERYRQVVEATGGTFWPIEEPDGSGDCQPADLSAILEDWADAVP